MFAERFVASKKPKTVYLDRIYETKMKIDES